MSDLQKLIQGKIKTVSRMCSCQFVKKKSSFFALRQMCSFCVIMVIDVATFQDWCVPR